MILNRLKSRTIYEKMARYIPGGVNSPVRAFEKVAISPLIIERGKGDTLIDVDGHEYIDFCNSWGALILGHAHPEVVEAVERRLALGFSFGTSTEIEGMLAEKICTLMPSIKKLRFVSSGTEATMSAVRLARGFTKRDLVVKFEGHYHGHNDSLLASAGVYPNNLKNRDFGLAKTDSSSCLGIPISFSNLCLTLPFNDSERVQDCFAQLGSQIACVIVEPIMGNRGLVPGKPEFLSCLRKETEQAGALLIFDEVITGFRVGLQGAQGLYGIKPDLTCLGKIIGGGLPAAAFGGREDVMRLMAPSGPVFQAGTQSGNPVAMQAGFTTLSILERPGVYERLEKLAQMVPFPRVGSMISIVKEPFALFFTQLLEQGIYIPQSPEEVSFVSLAHTEEHCSLFIES